MCDTSSRISIRTGMVFVRGVDSKFCESNVTLYHCGGLASGIMVVLTLEDGRNGSSRTMNILSSSSSSSSSLLILCNLAARLNVRSHEVNSRCKIVLRRMVFASIFCAGSVRMN